MRRFTSETSLTGALVLVFGPAQTADIKGKYCDTPSRCLDPMATNAMVTTSDYLATQAGQKATIAFYTSKGLPKIPSRGYLAANTVPGVISGWDAAYQYAKTSIGVGVAC